MLLILIKFVVFMNEFIKSWKNTKNSTYLSSQKVDHLYHRYLHCCMLPCRTLLSLTYMLVDVWCSCFDDCGQRQMMIINFDVVVDHSTPIWRNVMWKKVLEESKMQLEGLQFKRMNCSRSFQNYMLVLCACVMCL